MLQAMVQTIPSSSPGSFQFAQRFEFAVGKREKLELLLRENDRHLQSLDNAVSKSNQVRKLCLETQVMERSSPRVWRGEAKALHEELGRVFKCSRHATHLVRLQLDARIPARTGVGVPRPEHWCSRQACSGTRVTRPS